MMGGSVVSVTQLMMAGLVRKRALAMRTAKTEGPGHWLGCPWGLWNWPGAITRGRMEKESSGREE